MTDSAPSRATSTVPNFGVRFEFYSSAEPTQGTYIGAILREDLHIPAVPRPGEQIAIGWLPLHLSPTLSGWLTVHHVEYYPSRPWKDDAPQQGLAMAVVFVHRRGLATMDDEFYRRAEADGWDVHPVDADLDWRHEAAH